MVSGNSGNILKMDTNRKLDSQGAAKRGSLIGHEASWRVNYSFLMTVTSDLPTVCKVVRTHSGEQEMEPCSVAQINTFAQAQT